jgi:hypothetical protein
MNRVNAGSDGREIQAKTGAAGVGRRVVAWMTGRTGQAIAGLAVFLYRRRALALPLAVVLLASWYINAAVADRWAGEAFGARRFLSLLPLFVLGLAAWVQPAAGAARVRVTRAALACALVALNLLLLFQYQLFMKGLHGVAPYPHGWFDLWVARFVVPFRLPAWCLR